ncbi:lytic transglycosylase domain-containing protein [Patescibacteria group bacterium]|nr:lytic transglycosylase domain-containing protein [Patescibacteria group bacterium]
MKNDNRFIIVFFVVLSAWLGYSLVKNTEKDLIIRQLDKQNSILISQLDGAKSLADSLSRGQLINFVINPEEKILFCDSLFTMQNEFIRERLQTEITFLLQRQQFLLLSWLRSGRYFDLFENELTVAGLSQDLKYLALLESGLDPSIISVAKAVGLWQFIESTGRKYNLPVKQGLDMRRDPIAATKAAVKHLADLYQANKSWPITLACYNAGSARVQKQMLEQKTDNYFVLRLPNETRRYFFLIMAVKLIFSQPDRFLPGLIDVQKYDSLFKRIAKVSIKLEKNIKIDDLAKLVKVDPLIFMETNPSFTGNLVVKGNHRINVVVK